MFEADTPILNQYKPPPYLFSSSLKNRCLMRVTEKDYIFQKSNSAKKAMTVLEVIMVFFIVAILAVSVIPRFQIHYEVKLQAATKRVTSDIRYTQSLAVTQHQDYVIEFDVGSDIYQVYRVSDEIWRTVTGFQNGEGTLCLKCFTEKAFKENIHIHWEGEKNSFISDNIARKILALVGLSKPPKIEKRLRQKFFQKETFEVLDHINNICFKKYKTTGNIPARLRDGYTVDDLKRIATTKSHDPYFKKNNWQFFNPVTLFTKKNIEIYLKQKPEDFKTQRSLLDWAKNKNNELNGKTT